MAVILNGKFLKGRNFARAVYFMPVILGAAVVSTIWKLVFSTPTGPIYLFMQNVLGIENPPAILSSYSYAFPAVIAAQIWQNMGYSMVIFLAALQNISADLYEAAYIDGANEWIIMLRIYVPTSLPSIATITLFAFVYHWNSWFDGMLLMNQPENMPLQTYIQAILLQSNSDFYKYQGMAGYGAMNEKTFKAAQVIVSIIPVLIVYPFVQKFFTQGIVMGSVKE